MTRPADIKPFAQSTDSKNPAVFNLVYTNQDYWSMKSRLVDYIKERFGDKGTYLPNTFNDFIESSIAIMLIENWAFLADTLSFKMDQMVNEIFLDTVTEVENAFRLAKLVGFTPTPPIASRSMWIAQINNVLNTDVVIETPVRIDVPTDTAPTSIELFPADSDGQPILDADIIIPAGAKFNKNIVGLEGRTIEEEFSGTGQVAQTLNLSFTPVIYDSVRITIDGQVWNAVNYFTDSQPRQEFRVEYNSSYQAFVMFGNNRAGAIPASGSRIIVTYRTGGGVAGNIVTGFVENQKQVVVPGFDFTVPITYKNYSKGEFGYDGDTIDDIRRKIPAWIKTQDRAVTGEDYKTLADQFITPYYGQIGKSTAVLRSQGCSGNIIDLYVLAKDNDSLALASGELKNKLKDSLETKKMLTDFVCIKDGTILPVDISIDITLDKFHRKFEQEIRQTLESKVDAFFSLNAWDFGQILRDTDLIKYISDVREAQSFQITFVAEDESEPIITTDFNEIIRPDNINISFVYN